ncbi:MAG: amidophosphoribosyltransferase [bacterium]
MDANDKCGIFAAYDSKTAARDIYLGLHALQHRGQEGAGIVLSQGGNDYRVHKDLGLVTNVFSEKDLRHLEKDYCGDETPTFGLGHDRYSTSGEVTAANTQPFVATHQDRVISIAHNGDLTNAGQLKESLEEDGSVFSKSSDSEVILHKVIRADGGDPIKQIKQGLEGVKGAFSLLFMFSEGIGAVRDPNGFRPLFVGKRENPETSVGGTSYYFASETCAFDILGAEMIEEVPPGGGYFVSEDGLETFDISSDTSQGLCSFEPIYFSRPDSFYNGKSIHKTRVEMGKALWEEHPVEADLVTGVPDSANSATKGVAEAAGLPNEITLIRSHYTGRTFISPYQSMRDLKVKKKFNLVPDTVEGQRVVLVDDSIVRGTTMKNITQMFRECGAAEIHIRIASPPLTNPCYYGIDIPDPEELLVNRVDKEDLPEFFGADSVEYLSVESVRETVGEENCRACFTGNYPVEVDESERFTKDSEDTAWDEAPQANGVGPGLTHIEEPSDADL